MPEMKRPNITRKIASSRRQRPFWLRRDLAQSGAQQCLISAPAFRPPVRPAGGENACDISAGGSRNANARHPSQSGVGVASVSVET